MYHGVGHLSKTSVLQSRRIWKTTFFLNATCAKTAAGVPGGEVLVAARRRAKKQQLIFLAEKNSSWRKSRGRRKRIELLRVYVLQQLNFWREINGQARIED
jgi:hypothetical protein